MTTRKSTGGKARPPIKKKLAKDRIRDRAHEIYLERITRDIQGDSDSDWLQAEREMMN